MKKIIAIVLSGLLVFTSCGTSKQNGALIGTGGGAVLGAAIGYLISGDAKGAAIGATVGTAVGGTTGAIIGNKMDEKAAELAAIEGAQVETITDVNGLTAIKVTFDSGILFKTNSATLSSASKEALTNFATSMSSLPDTDITVYGHTDNTGTDAVNQKVSTNRANAVADFLKTQGIAAARLHPEGKSFSMPVADNATEEGRALNRRVEVYVTADANMIKAAEEGKLN